jgi:hypothetical protein
MFDLDREVATWSASVYTRRCHPTAGVAELTDHLYCEIERARSEGQSDEEAFRTATARLGSLSELAAEHEKNRSALGTACQVVAKLDGPHLTAEDRRLLLAHSVVWGALMIACALVLKKSTANEVFAWLLTGVFVPLWLASDRLLRRAMRQRPARGT